VFENFLVNFLNHDFQGLVAVAATEAVEVEVQELELVLLREFVNLPDEFRRDANLPCRVISEQVNDLAGSISVYNPFEVHPKRLLCHLGVPRQVHFLSQASLLPENWNRSSDLYVTYQEAATNDHDLFSLAEVGHVALVVDASCVVSGARAMPHTS